MAISLGALITGSAMSFATLIAKGVTLADKLSSSVQCLITHHAYIGHSPTANKLLFDDPIQLSALVDQRRREYTDKAGKIVTTVANIFICRPIRPNGVTGTDRVEPIDARDIFVLPDGTTGPIVGVEGLVNPTTNYPYYAIVWMGLGPKGGISGK